MNTLVQQFIAEVRDYLDEAARGFLALEQSSHDQAHNGAIEDRQGLEELVRCKYGLLKAALTNIKWDLLETTLAKEQS